MEFFLGGAVIFFGQYVRGHPKVQLRPIKVVWKGGGTGSANENTEISHKVGI